jgi:hypothetical protein
MIDLAVAKVHLRIDHDDDDADIQNKLDQAGAIVFDYIKRTPGEGDPIWTPSDRDLLILDTATLMMLSKLYDDRNVGEEDSEIATGYLPKQITAILERLRDPAYA